MQNFISQLISSVIIGTVFGVVGLSMLVSWAFSSHFDMHHNFNMLVFFPTDLILAFTVKLREKLWMRRYALIHFLAFMLYVVIGYSGLVDQNIHRAAPVGFLYVLWILVYTRLVKIQNNKLSLNLT
jgi:glucose-6-phosphate-specific signal transduction histidine kinase